MTQPKISIAGPLCYVIALLWVILGSSYSDQNAMLIGNLWMIAGVAMSEWRK
jgi:hypothetical protein